MSIQISRLQDEIETEVKRFNDLHKRMQQHNKDRSGLIEQENEVDMVKKEIDLLDEDAKIFKLNGPILIPEKLKETKKTINNRSKMIKEQLNGVEGLIKKNEAEQTVLIKKIGELKEKYIQITQKAQ